MGGLGGGGDHLVGPMLKDTLEREVGRGRKGKGRWEMFGWEGEVEEGIVRARSVFLQPIFLPFSSSSFDSGSSSFLVISPSDFPPLPIILFHPPISLFSPPHSHSPSSLPYPPSSPPYPQGWYRGTPEGTTAPRVSSRPPPGASPEVEAPLNQTTSRLLPPSLANHQTMVR